MPSLSTKHHGGPLRLRAVLMRSGTSKGLFLRRNDLPASRDDWGPYILAAMGSPDPYNRQLNGVGGGTSTQSKVAVIGRCDDPAVADIDYTFIQVPVNGNQLDFSGNCGNMAAGCGPFAVTEGLFDLPPNSPKNMVTVRIRNTNTGSIINSTFAVVDGYPVEHGEMVISGVAGSGAPVRLDFVRPGGAMTGTLLPTGKPTDELVIPATDDHAELAIKVSMVDAANPFVFVPALALGLRGNETPSQLAPFTSLIQDIRAVASVKMGLTSSIKAARARQSVPKVALVAPPSAYTTLSGVIVAAEDMDVQVRPYSMGLPHPALQMTGAVCLASACSIPGSIPHSIVAERQDDDDNGPLRFAQASGITTADHDVVLGKDGQVSIKSGTVYRTVRRLMEGSVLIDPYSL